MKEMKEIIMKNEGMTYHRRMQNMKQRSPRTVRSSFLHSLISISFISFISFIPFITFAQDTSRRYDNFFLEAIVQREKGNSDAAFDLLRHCVEIDSTRSEAYYYLAQYYGALNQKDKMLGLMKKALDLEPDNTTYLETLANIYISRRQYSEGIGMLERLYDKSRERDEVLGWCSCMSSSRTMITPSGR